MSPAELQAYSDGYQRRTDSEAWLYGLYFQDALAAVLSALFAEKGHDTYKYPSRPHSIQQTATQADNEEAELLKARLYMHQMMWAGKNWGNK